MSADIRFAITAGYESDREVWERTDRGCEIPPRLARDVAHALLELAAGPDRRPAP